MAVHEARGPGADNVVWVDFPARRRQAASADSGVQGPSSEPLAGRAEPGAEKPLPPFCPSPAVAHPCPQAPPASRAVPQRPHEAAAQKLWTTLATQLGRLRPHAGPMTRGLAVVAATSLAAALTVTADLLQVSAALASVGAKAPVATPRLVGAALGTFGLHAGFAVFGAMLTVAGLAATGLAAPGSRQAKLGQALASGGLGTTLSPFWLVAASGGLQAAMPGLLLACACVVGLQALALRLEHRAGLSPLAQLAASTVLTALAPLGAGVATGLAPLHCALAATTTLALGLLTASSVLWLGRLAATEDRGDANLRRTQVPVDRDRRLAVLGETRPTVFVDHAELHRFVDALRARRDASANCEGKLLLHGPSGTGKTDVAQAVANLGPWDMFAAPLAALFDATAPEAVLVSWFEQLRLRAQRTGRPQVVFFDEAELLFRGPGPRDLADRRPQALGNALAELLDARQLEGSNLVVVVSTNHEERLAPKLLQRFEDATNSAVVPFSAPTAAQLAQMVPSKLAAAHGHYRGLRAVGPFVPDAQFVARASEALAQRGAVGRDVTLAIDGALTAANAAFAGRWRQLEQAEFDAFVAARLRRAWRSGTPN